MRTLVLRLLTLVALVLMPFGMGATAATAGHHAPAAAEHCEDQGGEPANQSSDPAIDCAMACSMLATAEGGFDGGLPALSQPTARAIADRESSLHPETATPPPKLS